MTESLNPISAGHALQSMRDSDFDCYSAYAEAIDNSIQANADEIHVIFDTVKESGRKEKIIKVAFIDNGDGMNEDLLHNCLVLGYSSRYNDRSGIGRFGVGMTMGAIHECCIVEVFSKNIANSPWLKTSLDIRSTNDKDVLISPPKEANFPSWVKNYEPSSSGTLVHWSHYDRQVDDGAKVINESKIYFGRVFRKFIWEGISIFVNGERVHAIDPLYAETKNTKFPNDEKAKLVEPITIEWGVPPDIAEYEGQKELIKITLSLLPSGIRGFSGTGGRKEVTERYIDRNQGLSIVRHGREVFYGAVPYWPGGKTYFEEIDRWWGCEIEFSPLLDRAFQVKNIKRGAVPVHQLKQTIYDKINPTIKSFQEQIRADWAEKKTEKERQERESGEHNSGHRDAEKIAQRKNIENTALPVNDEKQAEQELLDRVARNEADEKRQSILESWKSQPYSIEESSWRGKEFIELKPLGGSDVLLYNNSHVLLQKLKEFENRIASIGDSEMKNLVNELRCYIDLLLLSYIKAETKIAADDEEKGEILEILRSNWGLYAHSYISDMSRDKS